jgi:hypothetical protein
MINEINGSKAINFYGSGGLVKDNLVNGSYSLYLGGFYYSVIITLDQRVHWNLY